MKNEKMFIKLKELLENAYCAFSNFQVSSIIITKDNKEYPGVNVESAAYTPGICAERNAINSAIARGVHFGDIKEVHILSNNITKPSPELFPAPCGPCRQVIFESSEGNAKIFMYNLKGEILKKTIGELLPIAFSKKDLI